MARRLPKLPRPKLDGERARKKNAAAGAAKEGAVDLPAARASPSSAGCAPPRRPAQTTRGEDRVEDKGEGDESREEALAAIPRKLPSAPRKPGPPRAAWLDSSVEAESGATTSAETKRMASLSRKKRPSKRRSGICQGGQGAAAVAAGPGQLDESLSVAAAARAAAAAFAASVRNAGAAEYQLDGPTQQP